MRVVLRPRFFACDRCDTVFADPERPPYCDSCGEPSLTEITRALQADRYFTRAEKPRR
jgi:rRNA maturation endonuclease Nob1